MNCAPVLITTLCRSKHLEQCISSLLKNTLAEQTDLFLYVDYPARDEHIAGYQDILAYIDGLKKGFRSIRVVKRTENFGFLKNQRAALEDIFNEYDTVIRTNDDAVFSPNFLEWINKCLAIYEKDDDVIAISGYSYPIRWVVSPNATAIRQNFVCAEWGIGYWKDKYLRIEKQLNDCYFQTNIENNLKTKKYKELIDARFFDFVYASTSMHAASLYRCCTDIALGTFIGLEDKYVIMPVLSKVRDNGFDGSGVFCQEINIDYNQKETAVNYDYSRQPIDTNTHIDIIENDLGNMKQNRELLNRFDVRDKKLMLRAHLKLLLYRLLRYK